MNGVTHAKDYCSTNPVPLRECMPSTDTMIKELRALIKKFQIRSVFIAARKSIDNRLYARELVESIRTGVGASITVATPSADVPWVDMAVLDAADVFVGNCGSTFSALVHRSKTLAGGTSFFSGQVLSTLSLRDEA